MLIMQNGTSIRSHAQAGGNPIFVQFDRVRNICREFAEDARATPRANLPSAICPSFSIPIPTMPWEAQNRGRLISEGHMRLATPLYNLALPMIAHRLASVRQLQPAGLWRAHCCRRGDCDRRCASPARALTQSSRSISISHSFITSYR